jgi:acetylornithine deacetylase/succinyl-diaminopimelate desuccinylase-like protein
MSLNIRFTEQTNPDDIVEQIKQLSQLAVSCDMRCDPVFCNHEEPVIKSLTEHMQNHLEHEITITRSNGATDARHFAKLGVPVSIIGIPGKGLHADDEAAEIKGLDLYESMLLSFVNQEATP